MNVYSKTKIRDTRTLDFETRPPSLTNWEITAIEFSEEPGRWNCIKVTNFNPKATKEAKSTTVYVYDTKLTADEFTAWVKTKSEAIQNICKITAAVA